MKTKTFIFKSIGLPDETWERYALPGDKSTNQINPLHKYTPRIFKLDEKTRKRLYEENPLDVKLYEYALELNKKQKKNFKFSKKLLENVEGMIKKLEGDLTQ